MSNIFGDYEILAKLGQGGMGAVFKAKHIPSGRVVALKIMNPGRVPEDSRQRFFTEGRVTARLRHRNIVSMHEIDECRGYLFLAMEFVEGKSLDQIVEGGLPDERRAATWMWKVALAVHHAHTQGLIHRDLKPANIMIDAEDEPVVTDFGIARDAESMSRLTATGTVIGTPSYMSPEQAQGWPLDGRSDVFSLGGILYALLTGRPPFTGASTVAIMLKVVEEDPLPPSRLNPSASPAVESICLKALRKKPEHRYDTPGHMAEALRAFLDQPSVEAKPKAAHAPRRRLALGLIGVAACGVIALALILWDRGSTRLTAGYTTRGTQAGSNPTPRPQKIAQSGGDSVPLRGTPGPSSATVRTVVEADHLLAIGKFEEAADAYEALNADNARKELTQRLVGFRAEISNAVGAGQWVPVTLKNGIRTTVRSVQKDSVVLMGADGVMKSYSWERMASEDAYAIYKSCAGAESAQTRLNLGALCLALGLAREAATDFDQAVRLDPNVRKSADSLKALVLSPSTSSGR